MWWLIPVREIRVGWAIEEIIPQMSLWRQMNGIPHLADDDLFHPFRKFHVLGDAYCLTAVRPKKGCSALDFGVSIHELGMLQSVGYVNGICYTLPWFLIGSREDAKARSFVVMSKLRSRYHVGHTALLIRHCERSAAIQQPTLELDCRASLTMTILCIYDVSETAATFALSGNCPSRLRVNHSKAPYYP